MAENAKKPAAPGRSWGSLLIAALLGLIGLWLTGGGLWLLSLGGSAYYAIAGIGCLIAGNFYFRGRIKMGLIAYLLVFTGTCIWAIAEAGTEFWLLLPRVAGPAVFSAIVLIHFAFSRARSKLPGLALSAAAVAALAVFGNTLIAMPETSGGTQTGGFKKLAGADWTAFGGTAHGARFAPTDQITPDNVGALEVAWTLRTGDLQSARPGDMYGHTFEATPIKAGNLVYICTPNNIVIAADADSGKEIWRFDAELANGAGPLRACRGVSWFEADDGSGECEKRIITATLDARLIALDALTGKPCSGFGDDGIVQLKVGLGEVKQGYYIVTSPPVIANGIAVIGGFVLDGQETNEPSGVIRAFDALTGAFVWSWDSGAQDENWIPGEGEHYSRGSPNSWSVMSADPELGLVYLPMGNATPDYVGMHRSEQDERYSSSVVALDIRTGERRWHFQTVRHDIWDYDIGSQPVLFDMPFPDGTSIPALAQPTKQGDIYILDRRTGEPLTAVAERKVPKGDIPEERYSPTQPVSVGFPSPLGKDRLEEEDMWGATPLDQLWCRIRFRSADYTGLYTPPSTRISIQYPSNFGVMDWGSATIDKASGALLVNSSHLPMEMQLIPQDDLAKQGPPEHASFSPQRGTPYAANPVNMLSPLGIPCNAPPWGKLTAIDLETRRIKWQRPLGTTRDAAPFGIAVPGAPNIAGSVATGGGLLFIGAAIDDYIRAFDTATGAELWRARLPAGGQAAPISYVSEKTGRQYIVIAAGGHQVLGTRTGDSLIAYALPSR